MSEDESQDIDTLEPEDVVVPAPAPKASAKVEAVVYKGFGPVVHHAVTGAIMTGAVIRGTPDVIASLLKIKGFEPIE